ncbi:MAG: TetR/AcrR family transcriptional regulator [Thermomicrobiales bacterium]
MTRDRATPSPPATSTLGEDSPTRRRILEAAKANLRRFGADKVTVVDIARDLGMSHSNVYRFFRTKAEILDAVMEEWLAEEEALLNQLSAGPGLAGKRLERLFLAMLARKRIHRTEDAEIFRLYHRILAERAAALARYDAAQFAAVERIVTDGVQTGEFVVRDIPAAVRVVRHAVHIFFDPAFAQESGASAEEGARDVVRALVAGFANREHPPDLGQDRT